MNEPETARPLSRVRLGDVCEILNGFAFKSEGYRDHGIRIIRISNVQKGAVVDSDPKFYPTNAGNEFVQYMLRANDLLVSLTGNPGRVGLVPVELLPAALNQRVACLRPLDENRLSTRYLFYLLDADRFERACVNSSYGMAQKNLSTEWLKEYQITLPSLQEQRCIVAKLDEQMATLASAQAALAAQREAATALRSAVLRTALDPATHPGWRRTTLHDIVALDLQQVTADSPIARELPYLGMEDIESQTSKILSRAAPNLKVLSNTFAFDSRHVLYGKLRPYLNKVACPDFTGRCSTELVPLLPNDQVSRRYLAWILRRPETVTAALEGKTGSRMPRANMHSLLEMNVRFPSLPEQRRIAKELDDGMKQIDSMITSLDAQAATLGSLRTSLLDAAFSGQV